MCLIVHPEGDEGAIPCNREGEGLAERRCDTREDSPEQKLCGCGRTWGIPAAKKDQPDEGSGAKHLSDRDLRRNITGPWDWGGVVVVGVCSGYV